MNHDACVSETNSGEYIAVCPCGWQGLVHPVHASKDPRTKRIRNYPEVPRQAAESDAAEHALKAQRARDYDSAHGL